MFVDVIEKRTPSNLPVQHPNVGLLENPFAPIVAESIDENRRSLDTSQAQIESLLAQIDALQIPNGSLQKQLTLATTLLSQKVSNAERGDATNAIRYEDGPNIARFLAVYEEDFLEDNIPQERWGLKLRRHFTDEALDYYLGLRKTVDFRQWEIVRDKLLKNFLPGYA